MSKERICHICGTECIEWCPICMAAFEWRADATTMSPDQRANELRLLMGPLEYPFSMLHRRIEELVGRPVWTHELAHPEGLVDEIVSGKRVFFADVIAKLPGDVPITFIGVDDDEEVR